MKFYNYLLFVSVFVSVFLCACTKDKLEPGGSNIPGSTLDTVNLPPNDFKVVVDSTFDKRAVISWSRAIDPEGDTVKYDIWLNEKLVIADFKGLSFTFSGLVDSTAHSGKIIAKDRKNKQAIQSFAFTTRKYYYKFLKFYEYDKYISAIQPGGGEVKQILKMRDGSYIIVGASYINGAYTNGSQIFALKIDYEGKQIWKKYFPFTVGPGFDVAATESKNGFLIVSHINLLNISLDGDLIWYKKIASYGDGDGGSEIRSVKQDLDGNIIIAGGRPGPVREILQEGVITKLNQSGELLWEKVFRPSLRGFFYDIQISTSNELIVLGTRETGGMTYQQYLSSPSGEQIDFWVLKLSSEGSVIWQKTFGDNRFDFAGKLLLKKNGNYVFVGTSPSTTSNPPGRIFEITQDGTEVRNLSYGPPISFTTAVAETSDGGLIATGFADINSGKALQINKFSSNGTEEWNKVYYEPGTFLFGRSILQEEDSGYRIAVSEAKYQGYGNPAHIAIYKTGPWGDIE